MIYEEKLKGLAERTADAVEVLWSTYLEGGLSLDEVQQAAALVITAARAQGVTLAELTLAGYLQEALGYVPPFAAAPIEDTTPRLGKALATISASNLDTGMQLRRLGSSEVLSASGKGFDAAISSSEHVVGYRRGLEANACELCRWLYRDGVIYPSDVPMFRHPGCTCHPVPVMRES